MRRNALVQEPSQQLAGPVGGIDQTPFVSARSCVAALASQASSWRVPPLYPLTRAHEVDSATRWGRHLAAVADSIFAQFGSGPRRSLRRSAERPARAAWAALRLLADVAIGATMELGRSWRTLLMMMLLLRPRGAGELRGHRQQAALKDQRFRGRDDEALHACSQKLPNRGTAAGDARGPIGDTLRKLHVRR